MAKKIIYINPGDMVDIRIIEDPEIQKNAREWNYQLRPKNILLHIIDYMNVNYVDPMIYFNNRIQYAKNKTGRQYENETLQCIEKK